VLPGSLLSVLWPLLTPANARGSLLTLAPAVSDGARLQVSLSKNVNSRCTTGPFISGAEHRTALCRASLSAPQLYMVLLFVGSPALTRGFLPTNLAIPQLLRSNVSVIVPLVMRRPTTVFTHRGLSPRQLTPMSGAHKAHAVDAPIAFVLHLLRAGRRATDVHRSTTLLP